MKIAAVPELEATLSEDLHPLKAACEILVTDRGRPAPRLVRDEAS
jgi:antitoxin (DNA-binding transcriptional repressor) of toxin-antitoxin stability system